MVEPTRKNLHMVRVKVGGTVGDTLRDTAVDLVKATVEAMMSDTVVAMVRAMVGATVGVVVRAMVGATVGDIASMVLRCVLDIVRVVAKIELTDLQPLPLHHRTSQNGKQEGTALPAKTQLIRITRYGHS